MIDEIVMLGKAGLLIATDAGADDQIEAALESTRSALLAHKSRVTQALVQTSCNLKCSYCYEVASGFHGTGGRMREETGRQIVELAFQRAADRPVVEFIFFGGEPLLNFSRVVDMTRYAKRLAAERARVVGFRMTTNGTLLSREVCEFLVAERFSVMVSIDGEPERADMRRLDHAGRGTTRRAIAGALRLLRLQRQRGVPELTVRATLTRGNFDRDAVRSHLASWGFTKIALGSASDRAGTAHDFGPLPEEHEEVERQFHEVVRQVVATPDLGERRSLIEENALSKPLSEVRRRLATTPRAGSIGCGVGRNMLAITADGSMYPCHRYAGEESYRIGSLSEGVDEERLGAYYSTLLENYAAHCGKCWARVVCGGQCPWALSRPDGVIEPPTEKSCDAIRRSMEGVLALHALTAVTHEAGDER